MNRFLIRALAIPLALGICTASFGQIKGAGTLAFSTSAASVNEAAGMVAVTVVRTGGSRGAVTVNVATASGTATSGQDFGAVNTVLSFASGETSRGIKIKIANDSIRERTETFTVRLSNPTGGAAIGTPAVETISILDAVATTLTLTSSSPANGSTGVDRSSSIQLNFSVAIDASTVPANIGLVTNPGGVAVATNVTVSGAQVTLVPQARLAPLASYLVQIAVGLRGTNGQQLSAATSVGFTTRDRGWLGAQLVETENLGDATAWSVAFDSAGNGWAAWVQFNGTRQSVRVSRYLPGTGWQNPATQIENNTGDANAPNLAIDPSGNVMVVWMQKASATQYDTWANRYTAGTGWGTPTLIETGAGSSLGEPRVAMDSSGTAIAVWPQSNANPSLQEIWANRYVAGSGWSTATLLGPVGADTSFDPTIGIDSSGNAVVTWRQTPVVAGVFNAYANRYTVGSGWSGPTIIESNPNHVFAPVSAVDGPGNALALWEQTDSTGHVTDLNFNRYVPGIGWGTAAPLGSTRPLDDQVALNTSGDGFAVWRQTNTGPADTVWARRYSAGSWGSFALIDSALAGTSTVPKVAVDPSGNAFVVWIRNDGTSNNVWANRYVNAGWGTPELIDSDVNHAFVPRLAVDAAGNALAIWTQFDGTRYNIWSNRFE